MLLSELWQFINPKAQGLCLNKACLEHQPHKTRRLEKFGLIRGRKFKILWKLSKFLYKY